jgi:flagellar biogenesis protein FliO
MEPKGKGRAALEIAPRGGLAGWLLERLRGVRRPRPRLALLERVALAPRQSLALVEAEGRRFLVATSAEGSPAFYALNNPARAATQRAGRVSW